MKDRMTLGFNADAAETAALTMVDPYATERIFDSCDYVQARKKRKNKIDNTLRHLKPSDRKFARAVLNGATSRDLGIPKSTFSVSLKKVEKLLRGP